MAELCGCERSIVATASFICRVVVGRGKDAPHPYLLQFARELTDPYQLQHPGKQALHLTWATY